MDVLRPQPPPRPSQPPSKKGRTRRVTNPFYRHHSPFLYHSILRKRQTTKHLPPPSTPRKKTRSSARWWQSQFLCKRLGGLCVLIPPLLDRAVSKGNGTGGDLSSQLSSLHYRYWLTCTRAFFMLSRSHTLYPSCSVCRRCLWRAQPSLARRHNTPLPTAASGAPNKKKGRQTKHSTWRTINIKIQAVQPRPPTFASKFQIDLPTERA